ncbi:mannose-6-phosphate isomerase [Coccomyxa subellipsoidea C-169]|uniref:mannose-6-phosphate isomerase n=1 Tax=Coccomyxa subellipsoidea (strain C-169) TaxID=574566 RepID=I0YQN7_COCSC|nr:mannose-6-phosphate isomerase [Coccomyxa subellipsoidea C-169]EIE20706.1 mannose-6-phosphate isomerase [Coccomyxa subellipsoidea C-169]|eukprot:XP_005645250.1 mannose-6-phosphate isomerase [Coccomyxa subellipsoidea C-169]
MLRLQCPVQNYAWGRKPDGGGGKRGSEVAALAAGAGIEVDPEKPYAELWMGTHPSGPATVLGVENTTLSHWLSTHPSALGDAQQYFGDDIPFLFKVLSVGTALSIQSHPDKALAQKLHAKRPDVYKDDNHKPEMAIALTDFEALCGFVEHDELVEALRSVPELKSVVGEAAAAAVEASPSKAALKAAFSALMTADASTVATAIQVMTKRLLSERRVLTEKEKLVLRLNEQYPLDVGVLSAFFFNLVTLKPGQAVYLAANVPHAYVSGELVECMATSDNVIRAGLTPKLRDTSVLCESLTYSQGPPEILEGTPSTSRTWTVTYSPPFDEFEVLRIRIPGTTRPLGLQEAIPASPGPQILLVREGQGRAFTRNPPRADADPKVELQEVELRKGGVVFIPANTPFMVEALNVGVEAWLATVNERVYKQGARTKAAAVEREGQLSWVFWFALGLLLVLLWAMATNNLPALQRELNKWASFGAPDAAHVRPT